MKAIFLCFRDRKKVLIIITKWKAIAASIGVVTSITCFLYRTFAITVRSQEFIFVKTCVVLTCVHMHFVMTIWVAVRVFIDSVV